MARPLRIEFAGAIYHVTSRGNEARRIFVDDRDREHLLQVLDRMLMHFRAELFAYVLMPNHYHLLLRTLEANLSAFMHDVNTAYAAWYNKRQNRVGHLFQGRFHGILVEEASYLARASAYVHANPVAVESWRDRPMQERWRRLLSYPWSSLSSYLSARAPDQPRIATAPVWKAVGANTPREGRAAYRKYMRDWLRRNDWSLHGDVKKQTFLGSDRFENSLRERLEDEAILDDGVQGAREWKGDMTAEQVLDAVLEVTGFDRLVVARRTRGSGERKVLIYLVRRVSHASLAEVGRLFGISAAGVSQSVISTEGALRSRPGLRRDVARWLELLS
jgi:REP element-mobilizing transposase RayT